MRRMCVGVAQWNKWMRFVCLSGDVCVRFVFADLLLVWFVFTQIAIAIAAKHKASQRQHQRHRLLVFSFIFLSKFAIFHCVLPQNPQNRITAKSFELKAQQLCQPRQQTKSTERTGEKRG